MTRQELVVAFAVIVAVDYADPVAEVEHAIVAARCRDLGRDLDLALAPLRDEVATLGRDLELAMAPLRDQITTAEFNFNADLMEITW